MIFKLKAFGTSLLGLYISFSDDSFLVSSTFPKVRKLNSIVEETGLKVTKISAETPLIGLFVSDTKPKISGLELKASNLLFREEFRNFAMGNLVVANSRGAILSPLLKERAEELQRILGVKRVLVEALGGFVTPGSIIAANNRGAVVHPALSEEEIEKVEKTLGVTADYATVNKSGFVGAHLVVGEDFVIVPEDILAPELVQITQVLGVE